LTSVPVAKPPEETKIPPLLPGALKLVLFTIVLEAMPPVQRHFRGRRPGNRPRDGVFHHPFSLGSVGRVVGRHRHRRDCE
jgi:hypothetical protein